MPEYLTPGVYIEEVNTGPRPIESVGTAMAAFIGFAPAGPVNKPQLITSWTQYVTAFGALDESGVRQPHLPGAYLSHAVYGYFLNGGGRCYVTRIAPAQISSETPPVQALLPSRASKAIQSLMITPKPGTPQTSDIEVDILPPTAEDAGEENFTLRVRMADAQETYENVSFGKPSGKVRNVVAEVNRASQLVTLAEPTTTSGTLAERAPESGTYVLKMPQDALKLVVRTNDFVGSSAERTGVEGLEIADDVTMVMCPDIMSAYQAGALDRDGVKAVQLAMINHCERLGDRLAILDPLPELTPQDVRHWRLEETNYDSQFATLYYPWISVNGPDGKPMSMPPCGHMAGIWSRNDAERGVHKAPANEVIRGVLNPVMEITKGEQDTLNPIGVNCIRTFTGRGVRVWGARTLSSDALWRYINVRRLFNMIEKSLDHGTQWTVFEPNDELLWSRIRRDVGAYLSNVYRTGALFGATAGQAYFVKCDEELNPAEVRDVGQVFIEVGIAPVKPAEFVVFRFSQISANA